MSNGQSIKGPVALVCEKVISDNHGDEIKGLNCVGEKNICVPKCCPLDEVFDTDKMR